MKMHRAPCWALHSKLQAWFLEQRSPAVPPGHVSQYAPLPDDSEDGHNKPHEHFQLVSINNTVTPSSTGEPLRNTYHRSEAWNYTGIAAWPYTPSWAPRLNVSQVHSVALVCEACLPIQPKSGALSLHDHHCDSPSVLWVSSDASIPRCRQCHASWPNAGIPSSPPTAKSRHDSKTHVYYLQSLWIPEAQH